MSGFRQDWERDGRTRFHWTSQAANVRLPLLVAGEGARLRLRYRRHFVEPTTVRLTVEGRTVASFEARADEKVAYRIVEVPLPRLEGRHPFVVSIEAPSAIDRPLGIALDWMEIDGARLGLLGATIFRFALAALLAYALPRLAGAPGWLASSHAAFLLALGAFGAQRNAIAFERTLSEGLGAYAATGLVAALIVSFSRSRRSLGVEQRDTVSGALVVVVLVAIAARLVILLHPQFYYPDVRVHSAFALLLARRGLIDFAGAFIENQFRWSLGLQQVGDHWYAFPYPPGFYWLASPLISALHYRPEVATSVLAAGINSLEALVVFALARTLGLSSTVALSSSAVVPLLPLFLARLSLAYFPALVGHAVDAVVIAFIAAHGRRLPARGPLLGLAGLLALCFFAYTQAVLNFAVLFALLIALELAADRSGATRRRAGGLIAAAVLGGLVAFAAFYARYVPSLEAMHDGRAVPEERILLDRLEREDRARAAAGEAVVPQEADPYTGQSLDLLRGVRKAGWRLYVFYGVFAPIVVWGIVRLGLSLSPPGARLIWAWGAAYLTLNLLSGGLPGPNLVRYNKDLELLAPLACLGLGALFARLSTSERVPSRATAAALGIVWAIWATGRAEEFLTRTFVVER